ncbi:MAG: hypothetical protein KF869_09345, partial [Phycisphaeraceae bacterium]|nr:hypothetical protein [Phycisphaeraceae bacterium]
GRKKLELAAALALQLLVCVTAAKAQFTGACCFPVSQTCAIMSPYDCVKQGGDFLGLETTCPTTDACDRKQHFGVGMSQIAARRLLREGVVHTIHAGDHEPVYASEHAMWNLVNYGVVIAPEIQVNILKIAQDDPGMSLVESAELAAEATMQIADDARVAFAAVHPGKPFHWSLHLVGLGAGWRWELAENSNLPNFRHHPLDVLDGNLSRTEYISQWGRVGEVLEGNDQFKVLEQSDDQAPWNWLARFSSSYYTSPWNATFKIQDRDGSNNIIAEREARVIGFDDEERIFTLDDDILTSADNPAGSVFKTFTITRTSEETHWRWHPCWFFKNGADEMEEWMIAYTAKVYELQFYRPFLPPPAAVFISDEDIGEANIDWSNYSEYLLDDRAEDLEEEGYTIDGVRTLAVWHGEFAKDRNGDPLNFNPSPTDYSPENEDLHSYLQATMQTAYNYHRERSTWRHLRDLWPKARLSQYQLGNGHGVTHDEVRYEVPIGPGESGYHGQRTWQGPVSWDEYNCGTNALPYLLDEFEDGQIVPIGYNSATYAIGESGDGSMLDPNKVPLQGSLPIDPDFYLNTLELPLFIEFTAPPNAGTIYEVSVWSAGVFTLTTSLTAATSASDEFILYYPSDPYIDFADNEVVWPLMSTYCDRYGEDVDAAGFKSTAKKWAAECARGQTRALPNNPYSVYYSMGEINGVYDGVPEKVSFLATYPHQPFVSQDGWMDGADWGEIGSQGIDYGVNHFVWFMPDIAAGCDCPLHDDCLSLWALTIAIYTMDTHLYNNLAVYTNIACIGDWNRDGIIDTDDAMAFGESLANQEAEADLNNDGLWDQSDTDIYNSVFCSAGCAPVDDPGCTNREDCLEVDWNDDGAVGIEDIFTFLNAWFANDPAAYNFGGTPGVPAIFAYLTMWFTVGIGPCE